MKTPKTKLECFLEDEIRKLEQKLEIKENLIARLTTLVEYFNDPHYTPEQENDD